MRENVTIIIPTCGTNILQALLPCLQTLFIHTDGLRTGHAHRRVVVVANGMKEENKKIFDAFMQKHEEEKNVAVYWYEKPLGYVGAINAGLEKVMAEGDTDYVVFLNDDTQVLADNWIDMLLAPFRKDEKMGLVGAKSIPCPVTDIMFPLGWCVMVKKEVLDKVGVLGNEWGLGYGDDIDLAIRAMQAGYKTYSYVQYDKGYFPMRHEAENTMHSGELFSFEDWNKHTAKNRELLAKKYWQTVHVVVPVYRRYRKLEKTLESLYAQYYTKLKIHVVADGHDAKIEEIIAAKKTLFAAKGMEIEYTYVEHEGLFGARPRMSVLEALSGAEDEWVVFVDSDNQIAPDYVLKLWQATFRTRLFGK